MMKICWFRLGGLILCIVTTVFCQDQKWTRYHPSTTLWPRASLDVVMATQDMLAQSSVRRESSFNPMLKMRWQDPYSKPQWQTPMYKPKWQNPYSKPQWQLSKAHHMKPFTKRPFKTLNAVDNGPWHNGWNSQKQWRPVGFHSTSFRKPTQAPRNNAAGAWPDYIPPLSVIRPSMDDPHALLNSRR